jgi:hypothetical protein
VSVVRDHGAVVPQALLIWLVTYASLLAVIGFVLAVARGFSGRPLTDGAILRTASTLAFVGATVLWVVLVIAD